MLCVLPRNDSDALCQRQWPRHKRTDEQKNALTNCVLFLFFHTQQACSLTQMAIKRATLHSANLIFLRAITHTLLFFHVNTLKWKHTGMHCGCDRSCWKLSQIVWHRSFGCVENVPNTNMCWLRRLASKQWRRSHKVWSVSQLWTRAHARCLTGEVFEVFSERPLPRTTLSATSSRCFFNRVSLFKANVCVMRWNRGTYGMDWFGLVAIQKSPARTPRVSVQPAGFNKIWKEMWEQWKQVIFEGVLRKIMTLQLYKQLNIVIIAVRPNVYAVVTAVSVESIEIIEFSCREI